ncbi:MAG: hypothetical protein K0Q95_688 [Bacteroidota bacterium]|jgi:hypothetical protein|nr:hypothetical protein [Bacteroidota bacterium]
MKTRSLLIILSVLTLLYSCEKDTNELISSYTPSPAPVVYPNYSKLAVGNYWVYQRSTLNTSGTYIPTVVDSCYIDRDTMIGGNTYYVYTEPSISGGTMTHYYRDSLHYILDLHKIVFSSQDFSTIFKSGYMVMSPGDTVSRYESKMIQKDSVVNEMNGSYTSSTFITNYYMYPSYSSGGATRYIYSRYSKDVGIVEQSLPFASSNPNYEIRQLLRFHVN